MATVLATVSTEHRERLMRHVDALPGLADEIEKTPWSSLAPMLRDQHEFLVTTLIPHMESVESGVHQALDQLLSCRLAMEPMEREHGEIRKLIDRVGVLAASEAPSAPQYVELNRVLVKLYSILKVHLREESMYIPILEHNLDERQVSALAASMEHAARVEL